MRGRAFTPAFSGECLLCMDETSNFSVSLRAQRQSNRYTTPVKNISAFRNSYDLHDSIYETSEIRLFTNSPSQMMASTSSYSRIVFSYPASDDDFISDIRLRSSGVNLLSSMQDEVAPSSNRLGPSIGIHPSPCPQHDLQQPYSSRLAF